MKGFLAWWRAEDRYVLLAKALLLALLPVFCCIAYCAAQGRRIGDVYLPMSEWNDELFYYKQVEGIVRYGYPLGYFGFNESHALKLSFAAWSPVLLFPWVVWGVLFGWNLMSPVLCNIFLMSLCCFLFVWLVRLSWKQLGILALLFCLYTPFVRYMLSGMPEVICFSLSILFYALSMNYLRQERGYKLVLLFLLSGVMTLMRPYLLLFLLLPACLWIRRSGWKGVVGSAAAAAVVVGAYACIKHYLGAEYFDPLFFTDWLDAFRERGAAGGIRYTLGKLFYMGKGFLGYVRAGIREGVAAGAFFAGHLVCMCVLLGQGLKDILSPKRRGRQSALVEIHLAFSFVSMLFALLLMYKLVEGSKHLLTFMAAAVFVISAMDTRFFKKAAVVGIAFAYLYTYKAVDPYNYQVPFVQEERGSSVEEWRIALKESLAAEEENAPSYRNVVIWTFSDIVGETQVLTAWQLLYALPEGFGISCCWREYVLQNIDALQSRYLFCPLGGEIEAQCGRAGYERIYDDGRMALYGRPASFY